MASLVENECRLIIVGKTGTGKSSLGNSLLPHTDPGKQSFFAKLLPKSVTVECRRKKGLLKDGTLLTIVDTPGLFDTTFSKETTEKEISKSVALCAPGPHAILFVLRIGRFTKEEIESVDTLVNMFGKESINYFIVVFTGKDELDENLDEFLKDSPPYLKDFVKECNSRYVGIANKASSPTHDSDVTDLMELIYKTIEQNDNQIYSQEVFKKAERLIQEEIRRKQQELIDEENRERDNRLKKDEIERQRRLQKEERERKERLEKEERERKERAEEEERERKKRQKIEEEELENKRRRFVQEEIERKERFAKVLAEKKEQIEKEEKAKKGFGFKQVRSEEEIERLRKLKIEEEELENKRQQIERELRESRDKLEREERDRKEKAEREERERRSRQQIEKEERERKEKLEKEERKRKEKLEKEELERKRQKEHEQKLEEIKMSQDKLREDVMKNIESGEPSLVDKFVSGFVAFKNWLW